MTVEPSVLLKIPTVSVHLLVFLPSSDLGAIESSRSSRRYLRIDLKKILSSFCLFVLPYGDTQPRQWSSTLIRATLREGGRVYLRTREGRCLEGGGRTG